MARSETKEAMKKTTIEGLCQSFVTSVTALVREQVKEKALLAIAAKTGSALSRRRANYAPPRRGLALAKRSTEEIDRLAGGIHLRLLGLSGGLTVEELGTYLRQETKALTLPLTRLLDSGRRGQKRSTRYFAKP